MTPANPLPHPAGAPGATLAPELLSLDSYRVIIDARTPGEYAEDHIPGAVNLPVVYEEEFAQVGTMHRTDTHGAYSIGVRYSLINIARQLPLITDNVSQTDPILVYCFRGGKRSALWVDNLRTIGFNVHVLKGGWKFYRRWINEQLQTLPSKFTYKVLFGPTGCGKTRLLTSLERAGAQVLDLESLANHRGSLIGSLPGSDQPTQKTFDSLLVARLLSFDPSRPVWIESESRKIGQRQIPMSLYDAMRAPSSAIYSLTMPMPERVLLWKDDYAHHANDPVTMVKMLLPIRPLVGGDEYTMWTELAQARHVDELFARVMEHHYDPAYARSLTSHYLPHLDKMEPVLLPTRSFEHLDAIAASLVAQAA